MPFPPSMSSFLQQYLVSYVISRVPHILMVCTSSSSRSYLQPCCSIRSNPFPTLIRSASSHLLSVVPECPSVTPLDVQQDREPFPCRHLVNITFYTHYIWGTSFRPRCHPKLEALKGDPCLSPCHIQQGYHVGVPSQDLTLGLWFDWCWAEESTVDLWAKVDQWTSREYVLTPLFLRRSMPCTMRSFCTQKLSPKQYGGRFTCNCTRTVLAPHDGHDDDSSTRLNIYHWVIPAVKPRFKDV